VSKLFAQGSCPKAAILHPKLILKAMLQSGSQKLRPTVATRSRYFSTGATFQNK
jgi:hypothetical protein